MPFSFAQLVSAVPFALVAGLAIVIAAHPRNVQPDDNVSKGSRFLREEVGYKATVDRLAGLDAFTVRTLPEGRGLPARQAVDWDEAALARAEREGLLCRDIPTSTFDSVLDWFGNLLRSNDEPPISACRELVTAYKEATFLSQDMLRASRQTWLMDGNTISGLRSQAHYLRESGFDPVAVNGKISYASRSTSPEASWTLVNPVTLETVPLNVRAGTNNCAIPMADRSIEVQCFRQGVVLVLPRLLARQSVYFNGEQVTDAASDTPANRQRLLPLREGATLAFARPGEQPSGSWQLLKRRSNLSEMREGLRFRDPAFAGLVSQIDTRLTSTLPSTIDRNLQQQVQDELDRTLANAPARANSSLRGAIVLMDGLNGQIVAGATFPNRPDQLLPRDRNRPEKVVWLEQNQVFEALPVGSTAKVPFAGAIATAQPDLLNLRLARTGALQYDARRFLRTGSFAASATPGVGPNRLVGRALTDVSFNTAIIRSDNRYAVQLIREAWHANREAPQQADWLHNIRVLACAAPRYEERDTVCPVYLWGDTETPDRGVPHSGVRFEFDAETVEADPHNQLFFGPLGNGSYNWTLAQLTQSYARFMSGRTVSPTLSAKGQQTEPIESFLRGNGYDRSWRAVMQGMRSVISEGTARGDFSTMETGLGGRIFLYAKTGTPTVGYRQGVDGTVFVLAAVRTTDGQPPEVSGRRDTICAMRFLSINLQYNTRATQVARRLMENDEMVRDWMTQPCPATGG
ncbi:MAG: hypothetical protein SXU28_11550, partial [Pseudomonadota bacterium]|nr:hypothetical protein [Pseudomonadota bacterium]